MPIYKHENFIPLDAGAILWRYFDFDKFKSLLEDKSLFFCRADKFSDPFEGSLSQKEADDRILTYKRLAERSQYPFDEEQALKNINGIRSLHQRFKRGVIINCWQINETESDAMWRLYLKDNEGVAIQTTAEKITKTIDKTTEEIALSKVRYLNYEKDTWYHSLEYPHTTYNMIVPLLHKRIEFIHENEFRLFIQIQDAIDNDTYWDREINAKGKFVSVDLNLLIDKIYLPPTIDEKTTNKIISLSKDLGWEFEYVKSRLSSEPIY